MNLFSMFKTRKPKQLDPETCARLLVQAELVRETLLKLESHLTEKKDTRGLAMASRLHRLLGEVVMREGPAAGFDVGAFSGGVKPPEL